MPRPSNRESRRSQIVDAFTSLISEYGFDKTTTALIAQRSGLTQGLIHYHFKSKDEILLALIERLAGKLTDRLSRFESSTQNPEEALNAFLKAYLELDETADPKSIAAWMMIAAEAAKKERVRFHYEKAMAIQQKLFSTKFAKALNLKSNHPQTQHFATGLLATIHGLFLFSLASPSLIDKGFASNWVSHMAELIIQQMKQYQNSSPSVNLSPGKQPNQ